jgi:hypothetical protein
MESLHLSLVRQIVAYSGALKRQIILYLLFYDNAPFTDRIMAIKKWLNDA